jgi:hypothetical protein
LSKLFRVLAYLGPRQKRRKGEEILDEKDPNGELAREIFVSLGPWGRIKNLTTEEKNALELFFQKGKSVQTLNLGCGKVFLDPVFAMRVERAVQKYGHDVYDIINDIFCGFPEDGLNEEVDSSQKKLLE